MAFDALVVHPVELQGICSDLPLILQGRLVGTDRREGDPILRDLVRAVRGVLAALVEPAGATGYRLVIKDLNGDVVTPFDGSKTITETTWRPERPLKRASPIAGRSRPSGRPASRK